MSNEEEKRCPLCAEEMDWTDQQFKPCKCGYQVCVWCWHHIIDMAEKDETEGRCPACRAVYDKEKIAAMQANCERAATKNSTRKSKPPKAKPKANEAKKDLTNVRVIQRKMAYVIGLPLSLADEELLQRKEYFGQYGKVSKVSLSRTAGGTVQQFINDTCSVYITYSKEEEALKCIQSVHGFVLEGRFLRASFGTAKYCHAWLKNMPCNNPSCLYLHSIGADEDSFGKDEVAAVHTRSRVQQIVGAANNLERRSGNVLPPPVDDVSNSCSTLSEKSVAKSDLIDSANGFVNSNEDITCSLTSKDKESGISTSCKMSTFVDIVGRGNSSGPENDRNNPEGRGILNLCSELSSVAIDGGDTQNGESYSGNMLFKVSSSNHFRDGLVWEKQIKKTLDKPLREHSLLFNDQGSKDSHGSSYGACFLPQSYPASISHDSGSHVTVHRRNQSLNTVDHNPVHNHEEEASLPIKCVNSVLNDAYNELKFESSARSDKIYRNSNSFSNEEIVEHLRRINDDDLTNDKENSALDAVESSIISNIMSIDFDSCDDSLALPSGLSDILDETDDGRGSSYNSLNPDQSGLSFVKQDGFASQVVGSNDHSLFHDFRDSKDLYPSKFQYQVTRPQSLVPPGFSVSSRDPPPGFLACERTGCLPRVSSGSRPVTAPLSSTFLQAPSGVYNGSNSDIDFVDPAILDCSKGRPINGLKNSVLEMRQGSASQLSAFEEETRLWLLMQQSASSHQDSKFSQMFAHQTPSAQQELGYGHIGNGISSMDDIYGLSSRLMDQHQNYDPSSFTQLSQQKFGNGRISNSNGYLHGLGEVHHTSEVGTTELQINERLGVNKYYPGYGDLMYQMPSSGDVYTRVFGM